MPSLRIAFVLAALVAASPAQSLSVSVTSPAIGATVSGVVSITGTSSGLGATGRVSVSIDGGPFQLAQGTASWTFSWNTAAVANGAHDIRARARLFIGGPFVIETVPVTVQNGGAGFPIGASQITYDSSVDGVTMGASLWVPTGFDPNAGPRPLIVFLHGGGGTGQAMLGAAGGAFVQQLDQRGWLGVGPDGRAWGLASLGCNWQTSAAYVNNPDPNVGPGEQDILDAVDWATSNFDVDPDRIYLAGFSMGGRGTYIIGLKNPDRFAAILPMGPAIDMFEIFVRRPDPPECKEGMTGGQPGDSPFVDTMYRITSGRFLVENAYNLPVFHGHGTLDNVANNNPLNDPFLHGWHITTDTTWSGCFGASSICYPHVPTLSELRVRHPLGYDFAFMFSPVGHTQDARWHTGAPASTSGVFGTPDPANPSQLIGSFDFLASKVRVTDPDTVVYKTYTDEHRKAYWLEVDSAVPWTDTPAAIRAVRDSAANALIVELTRVAEAHFDVVGAGLTLDDTRPLTVTLSTLDDPAYDPALLPQPGETTTPELVFRADLASVTAATVLVDGLPLPPASVQLSATELRVGPVDATAGSVVVEVFACSGWYTPYGQGSAGSGGFVPTLTLTGCAAPGDAITVDVADARGGAAGFLAVGTQREDLPLVTGGAILVGPIAALGLVPFTTNGAGAGAGAWTLSIPLPVSLPATTLTAQGLVLDGGVAAGYALTRAYEVRIE